MTGITPRMSRLKVKKQWSDFERCPISWSIRENMEDAGIDYKPILDKVYEIFDSFLASDFMDVAEMDDC